MLWGLWLYDGVLESDMMVSELVHLYYGDFSCMMAFLNRKGRGKKWREEVYDKIIGVRCCKDTQLKLMTIMMFWVVEYNYRVVLQNLVRDVLPLERLVDLRRQSKVNGHGSKVGVETIVSCGTGNY